MARSRRPAVPDAKGVGRCHSAAQVGDDELVLRDRARAHVLEKDPVSSKDGKEALQELRELSQNHMELAGKICLDRRNQTVGRMLCAVLDPSKDRGGSLVRTVELSTGSSRTQTPTKV